MTAPRTTVAQRSALKKRKVNTNSNVTAVQTTKAAGRSSACPALQQQRLTAASFSSSSKKGKATTTATAAKPNQQPKRTQKTPAALLAEEQEIWSGVRTLGESGVPTVHRIISEEPNETGCHHCPTARCHCQRVTEILAQCYSQSNQKRKIEITGRRDLCAKSFLPNFVAWMAELLQLKPGDTFVDLGSGNGSVCYQIAALVPGIKVIGVELFAPNADVSREAWPFAKPLLQQMIDDEQGRQSGGSRKGGKAAAEIQDVEIITGRLEDFIDSDRFAALSQGGKVAIWATNMLMPYSVTHHMAERFRRLPPGCRIMCMDPDCYPHQRSVHRSRDPQAFQLFDMLDIRWPVGAVEWCKEEGTVFRHIRTEVEHPLGSIVPKTSN